MAHSTAIDRSLVAFAASVAEAADESKRERARAMDAIIDLLFERAEMRALLQNCLPYVPDAIADAIREGN